MFLTLFWLNHFTGWEAPTWHNRFRTSLCERYLGSIYQPCLVLRGKEMSLSRCFCLYNKLPKSDPSVVYCPQSFSGGGLYLNGIWLLWTMELVTIKTCMVGYYGACIMGYYGTSMQVTMIVHERLLWSVWWVTMGRVCRLLWLCMNGYCGWFVMGYYGAWIMGYYRASIWVIRACASGDTFKG